MRVLSPILSQVVYPALGKSGYFRSRAIASVVTYHGVLPPGYRTADRFLDDTLLTAGAFRSQLRLLKRHYNVVPPPQFRQWLGGSQPLPERAVLLTCDDGLLNNLTVMLPILQEEELECLFFVTGASATGDSRMLWYLELYLMVMERSRRREGFAWREIRVPEAATDPTKRRQHYFELMNQISGLSFEDRINFLQEAARRWGFSGDWNDRYLSDPLQRQRFQLVDAAGVKQLVDGRMTVGAHTVSHPALSQQPEALARAEIADNRWQLEGCTGQAVWALAYPFGNASSVGDREYVFAQDAGYECAFMNIPGMLGQGRRFSLPRVHVTSEMTLGAFEAHVSGFHENLRSRMSTVGTALTASLL